MCQEKRIDFLLLEVDSSGIIHDALSPPQTIRIPITVREMDLQDSRKEKTDCLRCAKAAWFCPHVLSAEPGGGLLGTEGRGLHCQGCSRDKVCTEHCGHNKRSALGGQGLQGGIDGAGGQEATWGMQDLS